MKVRALISFCGKVTMRENQVKEIADEAILADLLAAGYVENAEPAAPAPTPAPTPTPETDATQQSDDEKKSGSQGKPKKEKK
ncbi:MAG: hypothetical protein NC122_06275 [Faecalibacterium sp.]|nr:hypothetical protein [Ruminococcus sp.]MCM1392100.1 hypothetical protein [Ruminococcus sp.]MCM1485797.1 hypothetical protein [Faecalibacterium sp.]